MKSLMDWFKRLFQPARSDVGQQAPIASPPPSPAAAAPHPPAHPPASIAPKEPVLVRGKLWKNTTEDRWESPRTDQAPCPSAVDDLVKGLGRSNRAETRRASAEALGKLGSLASPAIAPLVCSSVDLDASVRQAVLNALDAIDPGWPDNAEAQKAIPSLLESLKSWSPDISKASFRTLRRIGLPAVAQLNGALLEGEDTVDKVYVIQLLFQLGDGAEAALPGLTRALRSEYVRTRIAAADALSNLGPRAEPAMPALIENLTDPTAEARQAMAACLCEIGPAAEPAIPALVPLLADRKPEVREAAASALKCLGVKAVPAMIEIVKARDLQRMKQWVESASRFWHRSHASPIITDLGQVLDNLSWAAYDIFEERESLESAQESALRILGVSASISDEVVQVIAEALADPSPRIKLAAIQALGEIGGPAMPVLPALNLAALDPNPRVRDRAIQAISHISAKSLPLPDQATSQEQ